MSKQKKIWNGSRTETEKLHPKSLTINITKDDIKHGQERAAGSCTVACAIAREHPDYKHISVDLATIRYTRVQKDGTRLRNIHITPPTCQKIIIQTDQGMKDKIRPTKTIAYPGIVTVSAALGRPRKADNKKKRRTIAALKKKPRLSNTRVAGAPNIPLVVGGKEPPIVTQRRSFGLRRMHV